MIKLEVIGAQETAKRFKEANRKALPAIYTAMFRAMVKLRNHVVTDKLNGQVLKNQTGTLSRSIHVDVKSGSSEVTGQVGTNLVYAKVHELGLTIPAHTVFPKRKKALKFMAGGEFVFAKSADIPAITMPKRPFLKPAYQEMRQEMLGMIKTAIAQAIKP